MTTRPDAPDPIGHARAHELDRAIGYAGGCAYCRGLGLGRADFETHDDVDCPRAGGDLVERKLADCKRIRRALDRDREARVLGLVTARPAWLPWSPLGDGRYRRSAALRQLVRDLALLGAATSAVWLAVAVWQAWH